MAYNTRNHQNPYTDEQIEAAYHEAGHAVAAYILGVPIHEILITSKGEGYVLSYPPNSSPKSRDRLSLERIEKRVMVATAGELAFAFYEGKRTLELSNDTEDWKTIKELSLKALDGNEGGITEYVTPLAEETVKLLTFPQAWSAVERLVAELLDKRRIGGRKARALIKQALAHPQD